MKLCVAALSLLVGAACNKVDNNALEPNGPCVVGFNMAGKVSKVSVASDAHSIEWNLNDIVYLWAKNSEGELSLNKQAFSLMAQFGEGAFFTSTLSSAMPAGNYSYVACYPAPTSVNGSVITFDLPDSQDGTIQDTDLIITNVSEGAELKSIEEMGGGQGLALSGHHPFHMFRIYIPAEFSGEEGSLGEFDIVCTKSLVGTYSQDLYDATSATITPGASTIHVKLKEPLTPSYEGARKYAYIMVRPFECEDDDIISFVLNPLNSKGDAPNYVLTGRNFLAGHTTSIAFKSGSIDSRDFTIELTENNIGEPLQSITLTAPSGVTWTESGSNVLTITGTDKVSVGSASKHKYSIDQAIYDSGSFQVDVEMLSAHVRNTTSITVSDMDNFHPSARISAPYLLFEDFSTVPSFSSYDAYSSGTNSGSKNPYSFLNGWSGERVGAEAGKCIRTAARRETSARYNARVDSAPISEIIAPVDIVVRFNYGTNNKYGGIGNGNYGQNVYVGYVTTPDALGNGSKDGVFDNSPINTNDKDGSYTSTPKSASFTISQIPEGTTNRISWRAEVENHAGANNTTCWFYLDNIVVQVKGE